MSPTVYLVVYTLVTGYGHNDEQNFQKLNDEPYQNMQLCHTANTTSDYPSWKLSQYVLHNQDTSDKKVLVTCLDVGDEQGETLKQAYDRAR